MTKHYSYLGTCWWAVTKQVAYWGYFGEKRKFVNTFCSNLNALKALNIEQHLEDIIFSQLVVKFLDGQA